MLVHHMGSQEVLVLHIPVTHPADGVLLTVVGSKVYRSLTRRFLPLFVDGMLHGLPAVQLHDHGL